MGKKVPVNPDHPTFKVTTEKGTFHVQKENASKASQAAPGKTLSVEQTSSGAGSGPPIVGYRRVLSGDDCDACTEAAGYLYSSEDLLPIHEHCQCGIEPVFQGEEGDLIYDSGGASDAASGDEVQTLTSEGSGKFWSADQLDDKFGNIWGDHGLVTTNPEAVAALEKYMGSDYQGMNALLRGLGGSEKWASVIDKMDGVFRPCPVDVKVYRGASRSFKDMFGENPKVGGEIKDNGFLSTSTGGDVAENFGFSGEEGEWTGQSFVVTVPKGTPAVWVDGPEEELILGRGTVLKIEKIDKDGVIHVRVVRVEKANIKKAAAEGKKKQKAVEDANKKKIEEAKKGDKPLPPDVVKNLSIDTHKKDGKIVSYTSTAFKDSVRWEELTKLGFYPGTKVADSGNTWNMVKLLGGGG